MSVSVVRGIGFGTRSGALIMDEAWNNAPRISETVKQQISAAPTSWAPWGDDNLLPKRMVEDIEICGILNSIIDGKARFALNNGVLPALVRYGKDGTMIIEDVLMNDEIDAFLDDNNIFFQTYGWMRDLCGIGNAVARIMLSRDKTKIGRLQRDDVTEMRYQKMNLEGSRAGIIEKIYLSAEWGNPSVLSPDSKFIHKVPLLNFNNPLNDLNDRLKGGTGLEYAFTMRYPAWGKKYYSMPLWYAALKWVKIAQGVPEMKAAMFSNNFRPKYMVIISPSYWEKVFHEDGKNAEDYTEQQIADIKNEVYDDIDEHLAGNENAYKTIFCDGYLDQNNVLHSEIEIKPIDDTTKQGELLPDSAAANSEIAFAMLMNPAILGANMPSGPYTNSQGGSNVRESALIQVIIHEVERRMVRQIFNLVKRFNGWDKLAPKGTKLEFIIPATIPTTLDTGSNTKQMVTGANPNNSGDGTNKNNTGNQGGNPPA